MMCIMAVHNTLVWLDRLDLWNIFPVILQLFHYKKEQTCTFMDTKASLWNQLFSWFDARQKNIGTSRLNKWEAYLNQVNEKKIANTD